MDESTFCSPKFDWNKSESYDMSIQLCLDGLSFSILDPVSNSFLLLNEVRFDAIDPYFAEHEKYILFQKAFTYKFRKVLVSIESPAFMLMPDALYDDQHINDVLALVGIKVKNDDKVLRNNIDLAKSTTVFAIPNFLYFFLRTQFPNCVILHISTPIVTSMLLKIQRNKSISVLLNDDSMTVIATENSELKLCNRFYCKEPLDYVYMILNIMNQLDFPVQQTSINIMGNILPSDARIKALKRFSRMVQLSQPPRYFNFSFSIPENSYKFNSLFLMALCA